jgi:hypothetical protein
MDPVVVTYLVYVPLSVGLTFWVARTLSRHGAMFLRDVFAGDERMAGAVNHLLVVGFWLINLGYVALALRTGSEVPDARAGIETLSTKVGSVLLVLGVMHFGNLFVLSRMRRRWHRQNDPVPPVAPTHPAARAAWAPQQPPPAGPFPPAR